MRRHGPADLEAIKQVKEALRIPVLSNGNVSSYSDALAALGTTRCDGVMSAEELLRDPALFARCEVARSVFQEAAAACSLGGGCSSTVACSSKVGVDAAASSSQGNTAALQTLDARMAELPDTLQLCDEYLSLCEVFPPSSVWTVKNGRGREEGPLQVMRHHLQRMLKSRHSYVIKMGPPITFSEY